MGLLPNAGYLRQMQLPGPVDIGAVLAKMPGHERASLLRTPESALRHLHIFERTAG